MGTDKRKPDVQTLGEKTLDSTTMTSADRERSSEVYQEEGLVNTIDETPKESIAILVKEGVDRKQINNGIEGCGQGMMETHQTGVPKFKFEPAQKVQEEGGQVGLDLKVDGEGPMAMTYDMELGWVAEVLGPTSGHWKRKACEGQTKGKDKVLSPVRKKRSAQNSPIELEQNTLEVKRRRTEVQKKDEVENETQRVRGVADAARQHCRAQ